MFEHEKHWVTVSLGIVTLATAALAAVIVVAGFSQAGAQFVEGAPRHLVYWRLAVAGIAIAFYLGLALAVLGGVFMARGAGGARLSRVLKELPLIAAVIKIFEFLRNLVPFAQLYPVQRDKSPVAHGPQTKK